MKQNKKETNCANCSNLVKGRLCKKLSTLINERDLKGNLKCKYHSGNNS